MQFETYAILFKAREGNNCKSRHSSAEQHLQDIIQEHLRDVSM